MKSGGSSGSVSSGDAALGSKGFGSTSKKCAFGGLVLHILFVQTFNSLTYFGLSSLVAEYSSHVLGFSETTGTLITNLFGFFNFGFAIVGGYMADFRAGKPLTIFIGLVLNLVGISTTYVSTIMHSSQGSIRLVGLLGYMVAAFGTGVVTPTLSAIAAEVYRGPAESMDSFFRWFYVTYNAGSFLSGIVGPILSEHVGYDAAFLYLIVGSSCAFVLFCAGWRYLPKPKKGTSKVSMQRKDWSALWAICKILAPIPIFWALFFNVYGLWVYSASHMDRNIAGTTLPAGITTSLNPFFDVALIPVFDSCLFPLIKRCRRGRDLQQLPRMTIGMIISTLALLVAMGLEFAIIAHPNTVSVFWQIPQYFLISW